MKRALFFILITGLLCACNQEEERTSLVKKQEGFIVGIEKSEDEGHGLKEWYFLLVIPGVEGIDCSIKTEEERVRLAQENNGAYYGVSPDIYNEMELDVGTKVIVLLGWKSRRFRSPYT